MTSTGRRQRSALVGDDQCVYRAAQVAQMLNQPGATLRTVGAEIGVSAAGVHRLMRECGYRLMWVTIEGACVACGAPNGGGYVTPGCPYCTDRRFVKEPS
jgi:DNA-directed RNA polymerase subunit RPC12/RpoP